MSKELSMRQNKHLYHFNNYNQNPSRTIGNQICMNYDQTSNRSLLYIRTQQYIQGIFFWIPDKTSKSQIGWILFKFVVTFLMKLDKKIFDNFLEIYSRTIIFVDNYLNSFLRSFLMIT